MFRTESIISGRGRLTVHHAPEGSRPLEAATFLNLWRPDVQQGVVSFPAIIREETEYGGNSMIGLTEARMDRHPLMFRESLLLAAADGGGMIEGLITNHKRPPLSLE